MFYYFGGYLGYVILGYFLHHYNRLRRNAAMLVGAVCFFVGVLLTYFGFVHDQNVFLETLQNSGVENWKSIEFHINFLSPNVVLMTSGVFIFFQNMQLSQPLAQLFKEFSIYSYGIFLVHYIISLWMGDVLVGNLVANAGLEQFLLAVLTFFMSYGIVKVIALFPKSKYLIG